MVRRRGVRGGLGNQSKSDDDFYLNIYKSHSVSCYKKKRIAYYPQREWRSSRCNKYLPEVRLHFFHYTTSIYNEKYLEAFARSNAVMTHNFRNQHVIQKNPRHRLQ